MMYKIHNKIHHVNPVNHVYLSSAALRPAGSPNSFQLYLNLLPTIPTSK
jgi:hypothetical protein